MPDQFSDRIAHLGDLYRKDPAEFERQRKILIEEAIEEFPPEHRSRAHGLQFRIDAELRRYKDPVSRMNRMVELFWEGVLKFQKTISEPDRVIAELKENRSSAKIIPLRKSPKDSLH